MARLCIFIWDLCNQHVAPTATRAARIGKPPNSSIYRRFNLKEIALFIEEDLFTSALQPENQLHVYMGDYGTWVLRFGC